MSARKKLLVATALGVIFALSVVVRLPMLNKPLCRPREWLSATVLRHLQIWHEMGITSAHFAPIVTYPGQANKHINNQGSDLIDRGGNYYYTSYPPLAYYLPYVIFELLHVYPAVLPLQILNLSLHFMSGLFVYLALRVLLNCERQMCVPAIVGFVVYIFSPETLWVQANVYMSDMLAQVFFAAGIYLVLRLAKRRSSGIWSSVGFGGFIFCFVYTEWLGVMFAFGLSLYVWRYRDQPGMKGLQAALVGGAAAAIGLTTWQYSWISGVKPFLLSSVGKFLIRSGLGHQTGLSLHMWNLVPWMLIITWYAVAFAPDLILLLLIWVLARKKGRALVLDPQTRAALLFGTLLPPVLHHLVFFNLTAAHEFAVLKAAPLIAAGAGILVWRLWESYNDTVRPSPILRALVCAVLLLFCAASVWQYRRFAGPCASAHENVGEFIASHSGPDEVVFVKFQDASDEPWPQTVFYAHRNLAVWRDESQARHLAQRNGVPGIVLFVMDPTETRITEIRRMHI